MKKLLLPSALLIFACIGCSDYNDITTSMGEINRIGWEKEVFGKRGKSGDFSKVEIYLPPDLPKNYSYDSERVIASWKESDSYYDNLIIEVNHLKTQNTLRSNDKQYLKITQDAIDKYGENYILKELKNLYRNPKISSLETNIKIDGKFFGRRIMYYKNVRNVNSLEYYYFTIDDGIKWAFAITFFRDDITVAESINWANTVAGTIKFKALSKN